MPSILVIDDQEDLCEVVAVTLEDEGFTVKSVFNSTDALKELENNTYDAVICDQNLREQITGVDIFKKTTFKDGRPLFYLSTGDDIDQYKPLLDEGLQGFFGKPYDVFACAETIQADLEK